MAITEAFTNSETIGTTEHDLPSDTTSLSAQTDDGVYQLHLDLSALLKGDVFELACYEKVVAGGTQRKYDTQRFAHAQSTPHYIYPSIILMHGWTFTLKKIAGTDRSITWSIRKVA